MKKSFALALMLVVLFSASPAFAAPVTIGFFGSVDMSFFGGPASSTFSGSATWDTNAVAFPSSPPGFGSYKLIGATFIINSVQYSSFIDLTDHGGDSNADSNLAINNGGANDGVFVTLFFVPGVDIGPGPDVTRFVGRAFGPNTMFPSTAVPQDLSFLPLLADGASFFNPFTGPQGGLTFTSSVPEAPSAVLMGSGVLGALLVFGIRRRLAWEFHC